MTYLVPSEKTRIDTVGQYKYIGIAKSGSPESDFVWKILRVSIVGESVTVEWADGDQSSDNAWTERLTKAYS